MIRIARPGPGNGWRQTIALGQAELLADAPHLVLEQQAQRLDELQLHVLGEAADVVVRLDLRGDARRCRPTRSRPSRACPARGSAASPSFARLLLEDADELLADASASPRGRSTPGEPREEALLRLDVDERHVEVAAEGLDDLLGLVLAQQAVVDEDAGELVADRLVHEQRGDRRVDAARERAEDALASRPARGSARPAPRSPRRASRPAARRRRRRGSSSAAPGRAACARPRGGTGRRRGARSASSKAATGVAGEPATTRAPVGRRDDRVAVAHPDRLLARAGRRRARRPVA